MKLPKLPIYLDFNATTPVDPEVLEAMLPWFTEWFGNAASSAHSFGWQAEKAVEIAREKVANLIEAEPSEITFTSGATEALNLGLKGVAEIYAQKGNHIITVKTEHKAGLDACQYLDQNHSQISYLRSDSKGGIQLEELEKVVQPSTIVVSLMSANNETGYLHPIAELTEMLRSMNISFLTDATQWIGKKPFNCRTMCNGLAAFSAHKLYGPKGIGALFVSRRNPRVALAAQIHGGGHDPLSGV